MPDLTHQPGLDFHADRRPARREGAMSPLAAAALTVGSVVASVFAVRLGLAQYAAAKADEDMTRVLDKLGELGAQPIEKLTVEQARTQARFRRETGFFLLPKKRCDRKSDAIENR